MERAHNVEHPIILKTMYILTIRASQNRRTTVKVRNFEQCHNIEQPNFSGTVSGSGIIKGAIESF